MGKAMVIWEKPEKNPDFIGHQINLAMIYDPWRLCTSLFIYVYDYCMHHDVVFQMACAPSVWCAFGFMVLKQIRPDILEIIIWPVQGYPTLQVACYITAYHCQYYHILSNLIFFHITSYSYPIFSIYIYTGWWFGNIFYFSNIYKE